jgi:hypothetical protein
LAKLVANFDIRLDPNEQYGIDQDVLVKPKNGAVCYLELRK